MTNDELARLVLGHWDLGHWSLPGCYGLAGSTLLPRPRQLGGKSADVAAHGFGAVVHDLRHPCSRARIADRVDRPGSALRARPRIDDRDARAEHVDPVH